ncbi:Rho GTPase-activating protein 29 [Nymphon striatum]|nr:Rho GTPase-activating protein 29 [Nymphon striatum]
MLCSYFCKMSCVILCHVSEFLMGDLDSLNQNSIKTRSCDNLLTADVDGPDSCQAPTPLSPQEIDAVMMKSPQGVEVALHHAKVWSKYAKDLTSFIERFCNNWSDYAKNLIKLVQSARPVLKEGTFMPFQSIYCTALDQDLEYSNTIIATCNLLLSHKYVEPLLARRNEHDRVRKHLKDTWQRELKRMQEAVSNLRKSKALYIQRQQDYEKARDSLQKLESSAQGTDLTDSSKVDKKRKLKEENLQKALEAETTYKACVIEANERRLQLDKVKGEVLKQVRELIYQCDQTMKAVTVGYFQLQHTSSRLYEPGLQYMERVKRQPFVPLHHSSSTTTVSPVQNSSQPPSVTKMTVADETDLVVVGGAIYLKEFLLFDLLTGENISGDFDDPNNEGANHKNLSASNKSWSGNYPANGSDSDSVESACNRSQDPSPTASPQISSHENKVPYGANEASGDELENDLETVVPNHIPSSQAMSKAAVTHTFRKLKTPSRCRECDSYVYFQGAECTECGLSCHKKCLEALAIQCGHKRLPRKMTTFGVELATHLLDTNTGIPPIVAKCISELEVRGIDMRGIYRVSGVKSKVEKLCQTFESGMELVDASGIHPSVVANVLKLYLRQLPEPLLTFRLYKDFINAAKLFPNVPAVMDELKKLVQLLPIPYYKTLAVLMHHLKREGSASLNSLIDTVHQAKVIELLIDNVLDFFGPEYKEIEPLRSKRSNSKLFIMLQCDTSVEDEDPKKEKELEDKTVSTDIVDTVDTVQDLEESVANESNSSSGNIKIPSNALAQQNVPDSALVGDLISRNLPDSEELGIISEILGALCDWENKDILLISQCCNLPLFTLADSPNIMLASIPTIDPNGRNATQRNATQRNATQRNATQRNATQRNATQRNASN